MSFLPCPYLDGEVEWTEERERHVAENHPDLLPAHRERVGEVLLDPDEVGLNRLDPSERRFIRRFEDLLGGKYVVAVIRSDAPSGRHWLVTAYITRRLAAGEVEWARN